MKVSKVQTPPKSHYGLWGDAVNTHSEKFVNSTNQRSSVTSAMREVCKALGVSKREANSNKEDMGRQHEGEDILCQGMGGILMNGGKFYRNGEQYEQKL